MKYCPNCGTACSDEAAFCSECGTTLSVSNPFGDSAPAGAPENSFTAPEEPAVNVNKAPDQQSYEDPFAQKDGSQFQQGFGYQDPQGGFGYQNQDNTYQNNGYQNNGYQNGGYQNGGYQDNGFQQGYPQGGPGYQGLPVETRKIPLCIIFTLITCGIYGIYWMIKLNDEINQVSGEVNGTTGGMVFLFSLITCGIYGIYWAYKMGERVDRIKGQPNGNTAILYLVLCIVGFGIINYALMQDTLNKAMGSPVDM